MGRVCLSITSSATTPAQYRHGQTVRFRLRSSCRWAETRASEASVIATLAIASISSVPYAPCPTGGCTMVHTVVSAEIGASPELVAALYADYEGWPRLFPATIRGVRLLADDGQRKTIEIAHASEGKVINILIVVSPQEIRLEEFKRRFDARFINRFEAAGQGTRYSIVADVRLKGVARVLAPLARLIVRARLNRFVLEPMRAAVENELRRQQAATRPAGQG